MNYAILRAGTYLKGVKPTGKVSTKIMDEELLTMSFSLDHLFDFKIGDSVIAFNNVYSLQQLPNVQKMSTNLFNYTLNFTGYKYELGKINFLFPDGNNNLTLGDFSINGNAQTIIELIVLNANRLNSGWTVGTVDATDVKNIPFTAVNLLQALAILADEFESEFWIDQNRSINFQKREVPSGLSLTYGKDNGLFNIARQTLDGSKIITRLYAFGSEKNLSNGYRDGSPRLKLPSNYLEHNTHLYDVIEHTEIFDDIYPHREGTVTHVDAANPSKFRDTAIDFNLGGTLPYSPLIKYISADKIKTSYKDWKAVVAFDKGALPVKQYVDSINQTPLSVLIPGVAAKVTFNSGQLAGYTFDIAANGWNLSTKEITLVRNTDEKALELPNDLIRPAVGDKYVITDIIMPESYVLAAENKLIIRAGEFLQKNSRPQLQYNITPDHLYLRRNNIDLNIGDMVNFTDPDFGLNANMRITAITKDLQNPYDVQFELSEKDVISKKLKEVIKAIQKNNEEYANRKNVKDTFKGAAIQTGIFKGQISKVGDLDLLPVNKTLIGEFLPVKVKTEELDTLKIPIDAPFRAINTEKISDWDFANQTAVKLGDLDDELPKWTTQFNEATNF